MGFKCVTHFLLALFDGFVEFRCAQLHLAFHSIRFHSFGWRTEWQSVAGYVWSPTEIQYNSILWFNIHHSPYATILNAVISARLFFTALSVNDKKWRTSWQWIAKRSVRFGPVSCIANTGQMFKLRIKINEAEIKWKNVLAHPSGQWSVQIQIQVTLCMITVSNYRNQANNSKKKKHSSARKSNLNVSIEWRKERDNKIHKDEMQTHGEFIKSERQSSIHTRCAMCVCVSLLWFG